MFRINEIFIVFTLKLIDIKSFQQRRIQDNIEFISGKKSLIHIKS